MITSGTVLQGISPHKRTRLLPDTVTDTIALDIWCKEYEIHTRFPVDIHRRFDIGLYQIHQGIRWGDDVNKFESYAASALHFQMVASRLDLNLEELVTTIKFEQWPRKHMAFEALLLLDQISAAKQQLFYSDKTNKTKRRDRYNPGKLASSLAKIVYTLLCLIEPKERTNNIYLAMEIMTKLD